MSDLTQLGAAEIRERVARREVSVEEVTRAHLDRIDAGDADIGAFLTTAPERASP